MIGSPTNPAPVSAVLLQVYLVKQLTLSLLVVGRKAEHLEYTRARPIPATTRSILGTYTGLDIHAASQAELHYY